MHSKTLTYDLRRFHDGVVIGVCKSGLAKTGQQPEGWHRLGSLPHDAYELFLDHQGEGEETTVFAERARRNR
jgi:hypothetical protein